MKPLTQLRALTVFLSIGVLLATVLPVFAASVTFRVPTVQADAGGTVEVPIQAVGAPGLGAIHLELVYDPLILTADTVTRGSLAGNNALTDFNVGKPGRVVIGIVSLDAIKGDGPIATVRFKAIGAAGSTSSLTLENSKAWESSSHAEVLVTAEAGKVTVGGGFPIWLIAIALFVFILLLLLIFFLIMRRRRPAPQTASVQPAYYAPPPPIEMPRARASAPPMDLPRARTGGAPPPTTMPEQRAPSPGASSADAFKKVEDEYFRLKGMESAGRMSHEQFEAALKDLMTQDAQGRYWMIGVDTGKWYMYDGQTWVEAMPY